jgi:hypothetical protein
MAASGAMPPALAARFMTGELAALAIVARRVQRAGGACTLPIDAIAAMAGVCRRTVQAAIRAAARLGLLLVKERRIPGRKSPTNIVRIISAEWSAWLRLDGGGGCKNLHTPNIAKISKEAPSRRERGSSKGFEKFQSANIGFRNRLDSGAIPRD